MSIAKLHKYSDIYIYVILTSPEKDPYGKNFTFFLDFILYYFLFTKYTNLCRYHVIYKNISNVNVKKL